jgi:hypothetical protein
VRQSAATKTIGAQVFYQGKVFQLKIRDQSARIVAHCATMLTTFTSIEKSAWSSAKAAQQRRSRSSCVVTALRTIIRPGYVPHKSFHAAERQVNILSHLG